MLSDHCVGEDSWESLDSREVTPINPKGNQLWIFIGRNEYYKINLVTLANWLIRKLDSNVGKDWRQGEKGMTEDEMVGWYHQLDGREFEEAPVAQW